jgi:hypothetical protein
MPGLKYELPRAKLQVANLLSDSSASGPQAAEPKTGARV